MQALQSELEDFFGQQTEIASGLRPDGDLVEKPVELIRYEMIKEFHLPLWEGGLMDQPHIWLLQYKVIDNVVRVFEAIRFANEEAKRRSQDHATTDT